MATKIYGVDGQREAIINVPLGNGRNSMKVEFKRGNNQRGAYYKPATHMASSEAEQAMIESSPMFKTGFIRLVKTIETEDDVKKAAEQKKKSDTGARNTRQQSQQTKTETAPEQENEKDNDDTTDANDTTVSIPEVTTIEEARVALKAHGANAGVLMNETAMKNYMAKHGIVFPNLEF